MKKCIPHFKIAPLDYCCSAMYLQNCDLISKSYHKIEFYDKCTQYAL